MPSHAVAIARKMRMGDPRPIAGVVLAGGRSSRMGQNKALLEYQGAPLIEHMMAILTKSGIENIIISGSVDGYDCLPDLHPYAGPAEAIRSVIERLPAYTGLLFIPVDMPLLTPGMLRLLLQQKDGGYYMDLPLPAFITPPFTHSNQTSIRGLLADYGICPIALPERFAPFMKNVNTQQDWHEVSAS